MKKSLFTLFATLVLLSGCATRSLQSDAYSRSEARQLYTVQTGTLESIRMVRLEGRSSSVGTIAGGLIGGLMGNSVGGGNGRKLMTVLGALAGAGTGAAFEKNATASQAVEILVKLDSGQQVVIVQEISEEQLRLGQRVRIVSDGRTHRVTSA